MKKLLIILLFLPSLLFGQSNPSVLITDDGSALILSNGMLYGNSLEIGMILRLSALNMYENRLTYNSTGQYVTSFSSNTVTIDGNSDVLIGNSVRFGSPMSGDIYTIIDTGATSQELVLNNNFNGIVTDEFFWGGLNVWYDESGRNNNATQPTAINQAKPIYINTDSADIIFDGIDDFLSINDAGQDVNVNNGAMFLSINWDNLVSTSVIISFKADNDNNIQIFYHAGDGRLKFQYKAGGTTVLYSIPKTISMGGSRVAMSWDISNDEFKLFINGSRIGTTLTGLGAWVGTIDEFPSIAAQGTTSRGFYFDGNIDEVRVYERVLTDKELKVLTK